MTGPYSYKYPQWQRRLVPGETINIARKGRFELATFIRRNESGSIIWHKMDETGLIGCSHSEMVSKP